MIGGVVKGIALQGLLRKFQCGQGVFLEQLRPLEGQRGKSAKEVLFAAGLVDLRFTQQFASLQELRRFFQNRLQEGDRVTKVVDFSSTDRFKPVVAGVFGEFFFSL